MELLNVIEMIAMIKRCSTLDTKRHPVDVLSDRIRQAVTEPNLLSMMENLVVSMALSSERTDPKIVQQFLLSATGPQGRSIHEWLGQHPRFAAMIASLRTVEERAEACQTISVLEATEKAGQVRPMRPYDCPIVATCLSQIAHGADHKAGNATLFRRQRVITDKGAILELPFYAANALRGQLRDMLADHFLTSLGIHAREDRAVIDTWFFQALYSGGALEEKGSATMKKVGKVLGNNGAIRTDGVRQIRTMLPALSMLGCSIGNKILPGRIQVGDMRPACREWGTGELPAGQLLTWTFLTRRDDRESKSEDEEHSGMIAVTEVLKAGVVLNGGVDIDQHASEMERNALAKGLELFAARGLLGAETRRGMGRISVELGAKPGDASAYDRYLSENAGEIREFLVQVGALLEGGE